MMKKFMCLLLALVLCNIPAGVFALEENPDVGIEEVLLTEDFEEAYYPPTGGNYIYHTSDTSDWSWTLSVSDANNKVKMLHTYDEVTEERGSKALALYDEDQVGKRFAITPPALSDGVKLIKYEFDVFVPLGSKRSICYINGNNKPITFAVIDGRDNQRMYQLYDAKTKKWSSKADFTPGEWVKLSLIVNMLQGELHLFENDEKLLSYQIEVDGFTEAEKTIKGIHVETSSKLISADGTSNGEPSFTDNIAFYSVTPLNVEGVTPANGATDVSRKDCTVEIEMSREIYYYDDVQITIKDSEGISPSANVEIDGNRVTVDFDEVLSLGEAYTVALCGEEYTFTASDEAVVSSMPVITADSYKKFSAGCSALNTGENTGEATLVLAVYDSNNTMVALNTDEKSEIVSQVEEPLSVTAEVEDASEYEDYTAKAFVVDNLTKLNMLRSDFAEESFTYSASAAAEINDDMTITVNGENMTVSGSVAESGERVVLICVKDPEGNLNHIAPVKTTEDGAINYVLAPASENNGLWNVTVSGRKITQPISKAVNFVSPTTQKAIFDAVQDAKNKTDVSEVFEDEKYKEALNINEKYFTDNAFLIVSEQKKQIKDFANIGEMMITAYNLLESVNDASWSEMSDLIKENESILMKNTDGYSYYKNLSETKQNVINKKFKDTYVSIEAFREAFSEAVDDYRDSLKSSSSSGGGGGGGGSRKTTATIAVTKPKVEEPQEEPVTEKPSEEKTETIEPSEAFSDMEDAQWAQKAVAELNKKGIVSGDGSGNFRPFDSILREEFVKMLVNVLELDISDTNTAFTDADENVWYNPYLTAAKKAGIITGNPDGSFGTGCTITRQDMSVMIYRALKVKNINLEKAECDFRDSSEISNYAAEAVAALQKAGIVSGTGEGVFAPVATANRAQAATIIFNLFDKGVIK